MHGRKSFNENQLVWVTRNYPCTSSWVAPEVCVWHGFSSLKLHPPLSNQFPDCEKLFCSILNITRQPTVRILVREAMYHTTGIHTFPVVDMKPLLFGLAWHIENGPKETKWEETMKPLLRLDTKAIFPVKYPDEVETCLASRHDYFFVPDRSERCGLFRGSIPMLDVSVEEAEALQPLLNGFGGNIQSLSQSAKDDWVPKGNEQLDVSWTLKMRSKVPGFLRYVLGKRLDDSAY